MGLSAYFPHWLWLYHYYILCYSCPLTVDRERKEGGKLPMYITGVWCDNRNKVQRSSRKTLPNQPTSLYVHIKPNVRPGSSFPSLYVHIKPNVRPGSSFPFLYVHIKPNVRPGSSFPFVYVHIKPNVRPRPLFPSLYVHKSLMFDPGYQIILWVGSGKTRGCLYLSNTQTMMVRSNLRIVYFQWFTFYMILLVYWSNTSYHSLRIRVSCYDVYAQHGWRTERSLKIGRYTIWWLLLE